MSTTIKMPAGKYYIGDPCYAISDEKWQPLLNATDYFSSPEAAWEFEGFPIWAGSTANGDGCYVGSNNIEYGVDAGIIGATAFDLMTEESRLEFADQIIEFENAWTIEYEGGYFEFGEIVIDTNYTEEDEDDWSYEDYDDEPEWEEDEEEDKKD